MKETTYQRLLTGIFCGFLLVMGILYLFLPRQEFSQLEKRYLAEAPQLTWESLSSGSFSGQVDTWMADHIPGRSFFVGLNACYDLLTGRQGGKDILLTRDQRLVEAPSQSNPAAVEKNMKAINAFAESLEIPVELMVVPSAGWASRDEIIGVHEAYRDDAIIHDIYSRAGERITALDVTDAFSGAEDLYYRTDHHWTSAGAYTACRLYLEQLGLRFPEKEAFRIETVEDFRGSTYSRSALWMIPGETLELWHGTEDILVTHEALETPRQGVFFRERLEETDKYTVFLDGNHSLVRLENPTAAGGGKLLVIRDSFSNCLGGFLAESFETVVLADLRYYRKPLSELIAREGFDRVLICYSLSNFLTDGNIILLR